MYLTIINSKSLECLMQVTFIYLKNILSSFLMLLNFNLELDVNTFNYT